MFTILTDSDYCCYHLFTAIAFDVTNLHYSDRDQPLM
ncbi:unnamed protein product [Brugia timori]|uniref:Uncharacterized protein n=1 Tax=Brugia timori TaxID=42155 RepID=A0A0R3QEL5_9BILA|nr:unnamed protein product [Brugia timori]